MFTLLEFKARPNQHQTHAEDLMLLGKDGIEEFNDKVEKFLNNRSELNITTKVDGAPAVACWAKFPDYPDNSICLKSFITSNKNCLSSIEEIEAKYGDRPDMATKLRYCLEIAPSIPAGEAWQGDCLYSRNDLKEVEINGTNYLTFHPNKIVYAFSENNPTYETIKNSDFGICFHTRYKGNLEHKSQSFNVNVEQLNVPNNIYIMSPKLNNNGEKVDNSEVAKKFEALKQVEAKLLSNPDYEDLIDNSVFMSYWNTFENANLSDKKAVNLDENTFFNDLKAYIKDKQKVAYDKKMATLKTDAGKEKATANYERDVIELEDILEHNKELLTTLVKALNMAANIKMAIWNGYKDTQQGYNTFYKHREKGYIPASMEGLAMSDQDGNIVKIVDRSTFSNANRDPNFMSGFEHEDLDVHSEQTSLDEKLLYRGESDNSYSKNGTKAGLFFATNEKDAKGFGKVVKYNLPRNAKIFKYYNSDRFIYDNGYNQNSYPELKDQFGFYSIDEFENSTNNHDSNYYLTWLFMEQLVARIELEKAGYDGVFWNGREDDGVEKQYQIWNLDIIQSVNESLEEPGWVKNTVNTVQNSDKDPAVIATKNYHKKKLKKPDKGAVVSATPGLIGEDCSKGKLNMQVIKEGRGNKLDYINAILGDFKTELFEGKIAHKPIWLTMNGEYCIEFALMGQEISKDAKREALNTICKHELKIIESELAKNMPERYICSDFRATINNFVTDFGEHTPYTSLRYYFKCKLRK